jgi:uncharacterized protein YggE
MLLNKVLTLSILSASVLGAQAVPVVQPPQPTISSSATAEAKYNPDRATISIAVQTKALTAAAAAADNAKKQSSVLTALRALGMTNEQLSTSGYSVNPEYRYEQNKSPVLTGYTVTNSVLADVHDIKQVGKVLDAALANGSNVISSLDFYSSNTDSARQQALSSAVADARAEAEVAAKAAGGTLGTMIHLDIGGNSSTPPRPMYMAKSAVAAAPETQINPGQQTITMSVSGSWHFIPNQ